MPLAGHPIVIDVSVDDITYNEVDGLNDVSFSVNRDLADVTAFNDADDAKRKLALLRDVSISVSGDYESGDATGQKRIRDKFDDGADLWVRVKFAPTAAVGLQGWKVATKVESHEPSSAVDDKVNWTATMQGNGLPVAV
jgi:predicted secreted protein